MTLRSYTTPVNTIDGIMSSDVEPDHGSEFDLSGDEDMTEGSDNGTNPDQVPESKPLDQQRIVAKFKFTYGESRCDLQLSEWLQPDRKEIEKIDKLHTELKYAGSPQENFQERLRTLKSRLDRWPSENSEKMKKIGHLHAHQVSAYIAVMQHLATLESMFAGAGSEVKRELLAKQVLTWEMRWEVSLVDNTSTRAASP